MVAYLGAPQFTEQNGWHAADPVQGARGMGGERRTPPDTGHVDLSIPASHRIFEQARVYVEPCQNFDPKQPDAVDGGFFFSTTRVSTPIKQDMTAHVSAVMGPPRPTVS